MTAIAYPSCELKTVQRANIGLPLDFCDSKMSYPSLTDVGSTDIALEHFDRPLINTCADSRIKNAEHTSLHTDVTSDDCERPSLDTSLGPKGRNAEYTSLPTGEHDTSHQAPTVSWFYRTTLDTWVPESLALFVSATSIVAITATLKYYDGTKSPELPYGITLNAIVSLLATISRSMLICAVSMRIGQLKWCRYHERERNVEDIRTIVRVTTPHNASHKLFEAFADIFCLVQDAASCGPLGSAISLFCLRARPLASFGAIIIILALAFDPFIQQILQYPSILSPDRNKESPLMRTPNFQPDFLSTSWLNAVSAGIWSGVERFAQQPSCPSGNCEWKRYLSTGWCSTCQDAISYARITNCRLGANILDVDRLNTTDSCLVDLGHGNTVQVVNSYVIGRTEYAMSQYSYYNASTILKKAVWPLGILESNLTMPLDNETYAGVMNPVVALG